MTHQSHREIRLVEQDDGYWCAVDESTDVASQGSNPATALANLEEAVRLHSGESGEAIEDEDAFLTEIGVDPEEVKDDRELPSFLQ